MDSVYIQSEMELKHFSSHISDGKLSKVIVFGGNLYSNACCILSLKIQY